MNALLKGLWRREMNSNLLIAQLLCVGLFCRDCFNCNKRRKHESEKDYAASNRLETGQLTTTKHQELITLSPTACNNFRYTRHYNYIFLFMVYRHSAFSNRRAVVNARISEIDVVGVGSREKYTHSRFLKPRARERCVQERNNTPALLRMASVRESVSSFYMVPESALLH
jgi:hypothetical protein